jgi:two-component system, LytTR family, response regulator
MLTIAILDDENAAVSVLRHKMLKHFVEEIELYDTWTDPLRALPILQFAPIDLLFLDVDMPGMNGLELLENLPNRKFQVIFTTAYQEYAIEAIRKSALDYLVKPVDETDLVKAVDRAMEHKARQLAASAQAFASPDDFLAAIKKSQAVVDKVSIPTQDGITLIPVNEIVRLEGSGSYAILHLSGKQKLIASKNLSEFEEILARFPNFFRTHKSHLVNLNHVTHYLKGEGGSVVMSDGTEVEVARRRKDMLMAIFK